MSNLPDTLQHIDFEDVEHLQFLGEFNCEVYNILDEDRVNRYNHLRRPENHYNGYSDLDYRYVIKHKDSTSLRIKEFPGNCSWVIVHGLEYNIYELYKDIENLCKALTYTHVLLSISADYKSRYTRFLENENFKLMLENINPHSRNRVYLYIKELVYDEECEEELYDEDDYEEIYDEEIYDEE